MSEQPSWTEQRAAQTAALDRLDFDPAVSTGGGTFSPSVDFATCRTCGAACQIVGGVTDDEQPTARHYRWHQSRS